MVSTSAEPPAVNRNVDPTTSVSRPSSSSSIQSPSSAASFFITPVSFPAKTAKPGASSNTPAISSSFLIELVLHIMMGRRSVAAWLPIGQARWTREGSVLTFPVCSTQPLP